MYTDEELAMLSPIEQQLARDMMAAEAAGRNPTEDPNPNPDEPKADDANNQVVKTPEELEADASAAAAAAAAADQATKPADDATKQQEKTQQPATTTEQVPVPTLPTIQYKVDADVKPLQDRRTAARAEIAKIDQQWADGELTSEERTTKLTPLQDEVDTINGRLAVMQTLSAANQQSIEAAQTATLDLIKAQGLRAGIDYSTPAVSAQFNAIMDGLDADPANATLSFAQLADKAHVAVMAIHGKIQPQADPSNTAAAATAAPAAAPNRTAPQPPVTLRNMPAAQMANENFAQGNVVDQILTGDATQMEANWERLTPAQRERILAGGKF